jgi:hypothetical protein
MIETDLAWAAGFIDGEGCVSFSRCSGYRQIKVRVAQTRLEPLKRLRSMFGGHISDGARQNSTMPTWLWQIGGRKRVGEAHDLLRPYLMVKGVDFEKQLGRYDNEPVRITKPRIAA